MSLVLGHPGLAAIRVPFRPPPGGFLAWIIASNIRRLVQWLHIQKGVRFGLAVATAYVAVLSPVVVFSTLFIPIAVGQAVQLYVSLPELAEDVPQLLERAQSIATGLGFDVDLSRIYEMEFVSQAGRMVEPISSSSP